jgi:hypothetical protein
MTTALAPVRRQGFTRAEKVYAVRELRARFGIAVALYEEHRGSHVIEYYARRMRSLAAALERVAMYEPID